MKHLADRRFWILCVLALTVRAGALRLPSAFATDSDDYLRFAKNVVQHGVYGPNAEQPSAFRPPGYPCMLAGLLAAVGSTPSAIGPAIFALHCIATAAILLAVAKLTDRLSPRCAPIALAIVAFDPPLIHQSVTIMSETVFTAALLWHLVAWLGVDAATKSLPTRQWLAVAVSLTVAALVRPTVLVVWLFLGVHAALSRRLRAWLLCSLLAAVLYSPWPIRNRMTLGEWIWTTTHGGYTLWLGQNPEYFRHEVQARQPWPEESFRHWTLANDQKTLHLTEVERDRAFRAMAIDWMRDNPAAAAHSCWFHLGSFWRPMPKSNDAATSVRIAVAVFSIGLFAGAICGIAWGALRNPAGKALLITILAMTATHTIYWSNVRMRAPIEPALAIFAAYACTIRRCTLLNPGTS